MRRGIKLNEDNLRKIVVKSVRRALNEAVDGGWEVDDNEAREAYEFAQEYFGKERLDSDIVQSLSSSELAASLAFLFRMNDFREWNEYKGYDDDEEYDD